MNLTDLRPQYGRALLSREISESMLVYYTEVPDFWKSPHRPFRIFQWNKQLLRDSLPTMVRKCCLFNHFSTILTLLESVCFQKKEETNFHAPQFFCCGTTSMPIFFRWHVGSCHREQGMPCHLLPWLTSLLYYTALVKGVKVPRLLQQRPATWAFIWQPVHLQEEGEAHLHLLLMSLIQ